MWHSRVSFQNDVVYILSNKIPSLNRTDDEYETKWVGYGNEGSCKDPKILWESTVAKVEDMISHVELTYYQKIEEEIYSGDLSSPIDTSDGRCYSIIPTLEMIKQGIKSVKLGLASLTKIYTHNPGGFHYESSSEVPVKNVMGTKDYYRVDHELLEMLDVKDEPCNDNPKYAIDDCGEDEIEKFIMKEYGCTPPFFKNKEKICTSETITKQVYKYWKNARYYTNCSGPCTEISASVIWTSNKTTKPEDSEVDFHFRNRVKVVKSYYAYSSLSLIAEIGGYFGLFLGVSINQITYLTSFAQERVQKYIQLWPNWFKNIKK